MEVLASRHRDAITAYVRTRGVNAHDADDIVQESLLRAWRYRGSFDPSKGNERMWLFGITRNQLTQIRARQSVSLDRVATELDVAEEDVELHRIVEASFVADMMRRLSPEHREVIELATGRGWSTREIADRLAIAPGTVKSRLHYGLRALRSLLEADEVLP